MKLRLGDIEPLAWYGGKDFDCQEVPRSSEHLRRTVRGITLHSRADPKTVFLHECPLCRKKTDMPPTRESYNLRNLISGLRGALGESLLFKQDDMACEERVESKDFFVGLFVEDDDILVL